MNVFFGFIFGNGRVILCRLSIVAFLLVAGNPLFGQEQDFRSWWSIDLTKDLTKNLQAELEIGQRFKDNSLGFERSLITAGLEYELFNDFEIGGGYRYIVLKEEGFFASKYRLHGDVRYEISPGSFSFQIRERIQYGFQDFITLDDYSSNNLTSRSRFKGEYDIFASPFTLHASYELFLGLNTSSGVQIRDHRYKAGAEYKLSMRSDLELGYMFNAEANRSNPMNVHVLLIAFSYRL
jgi:hypothetical protein